MLSISLKNNNIEVYDPARAISLSGECFVDCIDKSNNSYMRNFKVLQDHTIALTNNYQVIEVKNNFILKSSLYTALVDYEVYKMLKRHVNNKVSKEFLNLMYGFGFLVDGTDR